MVKSGKLNLSTKVKKELKQRPIKSLSPENGKSKVNEDGSLSQREQWIRVAKKYNREALFNSVLNGLLSGWNGALVKENIFIWANKVTDYLMGKEVDTEDKT